MTNLKTLAAGAVLAIATSASAVMAGNKETVQVFYDLLSNPASEAHAQALTGVLAQDWASIGDYSGKTKSMEAFLGQMGGFGKLIPDLNWKVEAMHEAGNFVTVRSRATGTPVAPMFGVDGQGRGFDILTIDIHEVKDGKIVETYHVEDWAGALQQLSGQ
ncbi:ester cyclase [Alisedimentitalea sp. MJ-SS2]|uniref:ester cyclase n=1 Tax=Aliisedimentitalea sp. MJ-SS2 TaxID=3049795 RepID=UPI002913A846|nr:ester cyclase [Alisedimentitalea sp. MJ-SS2]MDU8927406.1 ester cyclase [Alisedimentitalea sp. MJ-SS2]